MARANVELVHQAFDAFNRRDFDAFLAFMDGDVEAVPLTAVVEGPYRGHDGIRRWWGTLFDVLPDYTIELLEVRDLGDVILAALRAHASGPGSDAQVEHITWHAAGWRDGKVVWWTNSESEAEALECIRLRGH
jgi:ketosteroid isomerase-like protein